MNQTTLNTDQRLYLVKINWKGTNGKYIFSDATELIKILKQDENEKKGIEYIKTFEPSKDKFIRISKKDFLKYNSFNTELLENLKNISYFKK